VDLLHNNIVDIITI